MTREIVLKPAPIDAAGFAPFGQVIAPSEDGMAFGTHDAQLVLTNGTPAALHHGALRARAARRKDHAALPGHAMPGGKGGARSG